MGYDQSRTATLRHLILTRFNVRLPWAAQSAPDMEWLNHRFSIFERFTLPSMQVQTNQNFIWLVFFDSETPPVYRAKAMEYARNGRFTPIFVTGHFTQSTVQATAAPLLKDHEFLITTRLDNDDCLCRTFVEVVQSHFTRQEFEFLNFMNGYTLEGKSLYAMQCQSNAFVSLIERIGSSPVTTVLSCDHTKVAQFGPVRQILNKPGWLILLHGRNLANRRTGRRCALTHLRRHFTIDVPMRYWALLRMRSRAKANILRWLHRSRSAVISDT
jgi:Putative rhamnosyl transferase